VAAQQQQGQRVVVARRRRSGFFGRGDRGFAAPAGAVAAPVVDQPAAGDRQQPAAGLLGDAGAGPLQERGGERLLYGVLAGVELPVAA